VCVSVCVCVCVCVCHGCLYALYMFLTCVMSVNDDCNYYYYYKNNKQQQQQYLSIYDPGTKMKEAHKILDASGLRVLAAADLEDAAEKAVKVHTSSCHLVVVVVVVFVVVVVVVDIAAVVFTDDVVMCDCCSLVTFCGQGCRCCW